MVAFSSSFKGTNIIDAIWRHLLVRDITETMAKGDRDQTVAGHHVHESETGDVLITVFSPIICK